MTGCLLGDCSFEITTVKDKGFNKLITLVCVCVCVCVCVSINMVKDVVIF